MSVFEKLSRSARKAVNTAFDEARHLGHNFVGMEHILLGIVRVPDNLVSKRLLESGIRIEDIRLEVIKLTGQSVFQTNVDGYTPRARHCLDQSALISKRFGYSQIEPEHLMLAILEDEHSTAYEAIDSLMVDLNLLKKQLSQVKNEDKEADPVAPLKDPTPETSGVKGPRGQVQVRSVLTEKKEKLVDKYGVNLTSLAADKRLDPVIGREMEIKRMIQVLCRRTKNNPCLVGEPGVGKTAVIEGLAHMIVDERVPEKLLGKKIVSLNMGILLAGTKYRGEFEERLTGLLEEIRSDKDVLLFIDELHTIIGAGGAEGAIDASNILKPSLARGDIQVIGATTSGEYQKYIEKDSALERRFQPIRVSEPSVEDTLLILKGVKEKYEAHHKVYIKDKALRAAVELSDRYITDRFLPDKAVDIIDEACSMVRINTTGDPAHIEALSIQLDQVRQDKAMAIHDMNFEKAAELRDREREVIERIEIERDLYRETLDMNLTVDQGHVESIVAEWTGIPVSRLAMTEKERLIHLEKHLHEKVVGQIEAVELISKAIRRSRVGLANPGRPIGSFVFLGPTGVGKTELSKTLAETLFGDASALIRVDMSEFMEKHNVSRLVGSPPGYIGHEEGGQLTEKVRRQPYAVVLFDEIEKAHPDVFNLLLQILDDGILTDSKGRNVNFKNTVIIMTSNIGVDKIKKQASVGFVTDEGSVDYKAYERMKEILLEEMKQSFRPEFINRIDDIIVFHKLSEEELGEILEILLIDFRKRLDKLGIEMTITQKLKTLICEQGYSETYGARPLKRMMTKYIEDKISEEILMGTIGQGDHIELDFDKDVVITKKEKSQLEV